MKRRSTVAVIVLIVALALTAGGVFLGMASFDTTLVFQLEDAVSQNWVWGATAKLQDRALISFYQSDAGPLPLTFTHLSPGATKLSITAAGYQSMSVPVTLKRGANRLEEPIEMMGYQIPSLARFAVFESLSGADMISEIRPVGEDGRAVVNHPCLDLWIGCRVTVQLKDGVPLQEPAEQGSTRGEELFKGKLTWTWDPLPQTVFRYSARIPGSAIKEDPAPYRVIDYLIVVPDPRAIGADELDKLMGAAPPIGDTDALKAYLDREKSRLRYFLDTSWNVKGKEQ